MGPLTSIEARRLALQAELDAEKSAKDRNRLGQFATPTGLAADVLAYGRELMPMDAPVRFPDPALGTGSFYSALLREFGARNIELATAPILPGPRHLAADIIEAESDGTPGASSGSRC